MDAVQKETMLYWIIWNMWNELQITTLTTVKLFSLLFCESAVLHKTHYSSNYSTFLYHTIQLFFCTANNAVVVDADLIQNDPEAVYVMLYFA